MAYSRWSAPGRLYVWMDCGGGFVCAGAAGMPSECTWTRLDSEHSVREHLNWHEALGHDVNADMMIDDILADVASAGGWDVVNAPDEGGA